MTQENVEVVEHFFAVRNAGDLDAMEAMLHPEGVFDLSESRSPFRGVYRGREEIRGAWEEVLEAFAEIEMVAVDPVAEGDRVVVGVELSGTGAGSGIELQGAAGNLFEVRDGLIVLFKLFQTREDALAAARSVGREP